MIGESIDVCNGRATRRFRLTEQEINEERLYVINERLGVLCGNSAPTDEQMEMAIDEADAWHARYLVSLT